MPFKIYTYADPYRIEESGFWGEIRTYPHLCSSRTLVRGLQDVIQIEEIQALYCPIDEIVQDRVFPKWAKNIDLKLNQYSEIGRQIEDIYQEWHVQGKLTEKDYEALTHNKNEMLDAIRLFVELDINADSLNTVELNTEQNVFVELLRRLEGSEQFKIPEMPSVEELKLHLLAQVDSEREEKEELHGGKDNGPLPESESLLLDRMKEGTENWDGKHLVIHGIHQFSALQLRFISKLDQAGVEIIFLHNYLQQYDELYQTWDRIYDKFGVTAEQDEKNWKYESPNPIMTSGEAVARNFASLFEGKNSADIDFCKNYSKYKDKSVLVYDNISEFADDISDEFRKAESTARIRNEMYGKIKDPEKADENSGKVSKAQALAQMNVAVYTANKDVDELLQIYYPDYAQNRHFLSYPIGQFFVALYDLWDEKAGYIRLDYDLLKKCIYSGYLSDCDEKRARQLLKILIYSEPLFSYYADLIETDPDLTADNWEETVEENFSEFQDNYVEVHEKPFDAISAKMMFIYRVDIEQLNLLKEAIIELNQTAKWLFKPNNEENGQILFHAHFERLKEFIEKKQMFLAYEEERDLVGKLDEHLKHTLDSSDSGDYEGTKVAAGTLEDLQNGIYYFLKQDEDTSVDWFVKNFEQIEGDILLSKRQQKKEQNKVYHFACVSDRDMNSTVDEVLPWPLSDQFVQKICTENRQLQIYYTALAERNSFMRYALFYGLYFCPCETEISFVKNYGTDDETECFSLLRLTGLNEFEDKMIKKSSGSETMEQVNLLSVAEEEIHELINCSKAQFDSMYLCPYRYFLDYVLKSGPVFSDAFQLQQLYVNVLTDLTLEESLGRIKTAIRTGCMQHDAVGKAIRDTGEGVDEFFRVMLHSDVVDRKKQAENFIVYKVLGDKKYDSSTGIEKLKKRMLVRKIFGKGFFSYKSHENLPPLNHFDAFKREQDEYEGKYSVTAVTYNNHEFSVLKSDMMKYLNEPSSENFERPGKWCTYCADRNVCLASYGYKEEDDE